MISYSVAATVFRATSFDRQEFRKLGLTSGDATQEFSASFDFSTLPLPQFPFVVNTPNVTTIKFVIVQVTGGTATIRFSKAGIPYQSLDLAVSGCIIMAGVELSSIHVLGTPTNGCMIECFGEGI